LCFSGFRNQNPVFCTIQVPQHGLAMLVRRPAGYAFRLVIPTHLREQMRRRELWVTLDANDKSLAKSRVCSIFLATDRLFSGVHRVTQGLFQDINDSLWAGNPSSADKSSELSAGATTKRPIPLRPKNMALDCEPSRE